MTNDRLVSVITPCHNAAAFVGQTIESVLAQTHQPVEHLIVDDGSSDGSWAVIEQFAEPHRERLRAERVPVSRGASHARNRGAALARGEYLMFLDADDLIAPNSLGALVAALRERPDAIAYTRWRQLRVADECRALGARLGGRPHVSRTAVGRTLARIVGFERKERLVQALARRGIATPERLASLRRRELRAPQHPKDRER